MSQAAVFPLRHATGKFVCSGDSSVLSWISSSPSERPKSTRVISAVSVVVKISVPGDGIVVAKDKRGPGGLRVGVSPEEGIYVLTQILMLLGALADA